MSKANLPHLLKTIQGCYFDPNELKPRLQVIRDKFPQECKEAMPQFSEQKKPQMPGYDHETRVIARLLKLETGKDVLANFKQALGKWMDLLLFRAQSLHYVEAGIESWTGQKEELGRLLLEENMPCSDEDALNCWPMRHPEKERCEQDMCEWFGFKPNVFFCRIYPDFRRDCVAIIQDKWPAIKKEVEKRYPDYFN